MADRYYPIWEDVIEQSFNEPFFLGNGGVPAWVYEDAEEAGEGTEDVTPVLYSLTHPATTRSTTE